MDIFAMFLAGPWQRYMIYNLHINIKSRYNKESAVCIFIPPMYVHTACMSLMHIHMHLRTHLHIRILSLSLPRFGLFFHQLS